MLYAVNLGIDVRIRSAIGRSCAFHGSVIVAQQWSLSIMKPAAGW